MMSNFRGGDGGTEMTEIDRTLEGNNRTFGLDGGSKIVKNRRTSFMDDPLHKIGLHDSEMYLGFQIRGGKQ